MLDHSKPKKHGRADGSAHYHLLNICVPIRSCTCVLMHSCSAARALVFSHTHVHTLYLAGVPPGSQIGAGRLLCSADACGSPESVADIGRVPTLPVGISVASQASAMSVAPPPGTQATPLVASDGCQTKRSVSDSAAHLDLVDPQAPCHRRRSRRTSLPRQRMRPIPPYPGLSLRVLRLCPCRKRVRLRTHRYDQCQCRQDLAKRCRFAHALHSHAALRQPLRE